MARVTVEDCVDKIPNRFNLVLLAAQRAREISGGAELTLDRDRDKNPVVALREIAEQTVKPKDLKESLIQNLQKVQIDDDDTPDEIGSTARAAEALRLTAAAPGQYRDRFRQGLSSRSNDKRPGSDAGPFSLRLPPEGSGNDADLDVIGGDIAIDIAGIG